MKTNIPFLLVLALLFAACGEKKVAPYFSHEAVTAIKSKFEAKQAQVLLTDLQTVDKDKLEKYKTTLQGIGASVAKEWQVEPGKLAIESYVKLTGLQEEYRTYSYRNGEMQTSETVPQHVKDSFQKHFVCYPPSYWEPFKIDHSVSFTWDTLGTEMQVAVISVK